MKFIIGSIGATAILAMLCGAANAQSTYQFTTIAGVTGDIAFADGTNSDARFHAPQGIAMDISGTIYVADGYNYVIRKLTQIGTNWVVTTIAGLPGTSGTVDGTNTQARFEDPFGITAAPDGTVFVTEYYASVIRRLEQVGTNWVVTTIAGLTGNTGGADGTNSSARFNTPTDVTVDSGGNLFVADSGNNTIRQIRHVGTNWVVSTIAGLVNGFTSSADGTNSDARFNQPSGVAMDLNDNIYIADRGNSLIRRLVAIGTNWVSSTLAGQDHVLGSVDGTNSDALFASPTGIAVDPAGVIYVSDPRNNNVRQLRPMG